MSQRKSSKKLNKIRKSKSRLAKSKARLFVDPASISTGWALFEDKEFITSGTITVPKEAPVFDRLAQIYQQYLNLCCFDIDEVHIEQLVRNTHIFTHWSVGVIGTALILIASSVEGDIPIQSWQRHVDWKGNRHKLKKYKVNSEDELASIGMGLWYTQEKLNKRKRKKKRGSKSKNN